MKCLKSIQKIKLLLLAKQSKTQRLYIYLFIKYKEKQQIITSKNQQMFEVLA